MRDQRQQNGNTIRVQNSSAVPLPLPTLLQPACPRARVPARMPASMRMIATPKDLFLAQRWARTTAPQLIQPSMYDDIDII